MVQYCVVGGSRYNNERRYACKIGKTDNGADDRPVGAPEIGDHIWIARWLLYRIAEDWNISATLDPKPVKGDWNGAGMHTNFSTKQMREDGGYDAIVAGCEALGKNADLHVKNYGANIEDRLTGDHETQSFDTFSYGVSDRGASIRIPWQVEVDKKGYLEDRRPNANGDPYVTAMLMIDTVCSAASSQKLLQQLFLQFY